MIYNQLVKAVKLSTVVCTQVNSKKKKIKSTLVHHPENVKG